MQGLIIFLICLVLASVGSAQEEQFDLAVKYRGAGSLDGFSQEKLLAIKNLTIFDLDGGASELATLKRMVNLEHLDVGGRLEGVELNDDLRAMIPNFKRLRTLILWVGEEDLGQLAFIGKVKSLKELVICKKIMGQVHFDNRLIDLLKDAKIDTLSLTGTFETDDIVRSILRIPTLTNVEIFEMPIDGEYKISPSTIKGIDFTRFEEFYYTGRSGNTLFYEAEKGSGKSD